MSLRIRVSAHLSTGHGLARSSASLNERQTFLRRAVSAIAEARRALLSAEMIEWRRAIGWRQRRAIALASACTFFVSAATDRERSRLPKPDLSGKRKCDVCGKWFTPITHSHARCGSACRAELAKRRLQANPFESVTSSSAMGAASELLVCADLLRRGWEVYRSVSPTASCDLFIFSNGVQKRVEVKTASLLIKPAPDGRMFSLPGLDFSKFDVLAVVTYDGVIHYDPKPGVWRGSTVQAVSWEPARGRKGASGRSLARSRRAAQPSHREAIGGPDDLDTVLESSRVLEPARGLSGPSTDFQPKPHGRTFRKPSTGV